MKRVRKLPVRTVTRAEWERNRAELVDHASKVGPIRVLNEDGSTAMTITIKFPPIIDMCLQCCELHPQYCPNTGKYEYEDWESYLEDDDD